MISRAFVLAKKIPVLRRVFDTGMLQVRSAGDLPRHIYIYWDKGFDQAPEICRICQRSWMRHNPTWTITVLDRAEASRILPPESLPPGVRVNHYANLLRMKLLSERGGVWVDATLFCQRPLDDWLPQLFNQTDFFVFSNPGADRLISNWFIAATPRSEMMQRFRALTDNYWVGRRRLPLNYFWHHALFQFLVLTSPRFRRSYRSMPRLSAEPCHIVQGAARRGRLTDTDRSRLRSTPLQKLTHKDPASSNLMLQMLSEVAEPLEAPSDESSLAAEKATT